MLRLGYLPSDFHPMVLILGEAADLAGLAGRLRAFATAGDDLVIEGGQGPGLAVTLATQGHPGLRIDDDGRFVWCLQPGQALAFADTVESLSDDATLSGSEYLETGAAGEIPVKVSRGEYTDDFLVGDRAGVPL